MDQVVVGSVESNDIMIKVSNATGVEIKLESSVLKQFGTDIENTIRECIKELDVNNVKIEAFDKGALDFTIRARIKTAINEFKKKKL